MTNWIEFDPHGRGLRDMTIRQLEAESRLLKIELAVVDAFSVRLDRRIAKLRAAAMKRETQLCADAEAKRARYSRQLNDRVARNLPGTPEAKYRAWING